MKDFNDDDLEILEEVILEKAFDGEYYNTKVIDLKDLEKILTEFFSRTINLT
jgi:hypothetical protein